MKRAIVLCSGGLDSVVSAHYAKKKLGYKLKILFFNYGQRSLLAERKYARNCAKDLKADFIEVKINLNYIKAPLVDNNKIVQNKVSLHNTKKESDKWYFPCRNIIFLSYASALAEDYYLNNQKYDIIVGFKSEGKEPFPDASEVFLKDFNKMMKNSTNARTRIIAPFMKKDKEDIIKIGEKLNVDFNKTFSCYSPHSKHCGSCLACRLRKEGFYWANIKDPTKYN